MYINVLNFGIKMQNDKNGILFAQKMNLFFQLRKYKQNMSCSRCNKAIICSFKKNCKNAKQYVELNQLYFNKTRENEHRGYIFSYITLISSPSVLLYTEMFGMSYLFWSPFLFSSISAGFFMKAGKYYSKYRQNNNLSG